MSPSSYLYTSYKYVIFSRGILYMNDLKKLWAHCNVAFAIIGVQGLATQGLVRPFVL